MRPDTFSPDISDIPNDCPEMSGSLCLGMYGLSGQCPAHVRYVKAPISGEVVARNTTKISLFFSPRSRPLNLLPSFSQTGRLVADTH